MTICGDYDADGVTGTALLVGALRAAGARVDWYLPHRYHDGYGLNNGALDRLAASLDMDLTALAIRFALDTPGIDVALVGVSTNDELQTALAAWRRPALTAEEYAAVAAFDRSDADWSHPERRPEGRPAA